MWITRTFCIFFMLLVNNMVNAGTIDTSEQQPFEQCAYCHEYDGNSIMPDYPRLAGQQRSYLVKQLLDFKTGKRKSLMQATAELLTEQDIQSVATYFSQQTAASINSETDSAAVANAKTVFFNGDAKRGLIACASCHGQAALGSDDVPQLAGQHQNYLSTQLALFKNGQRSNDKDAVMRNIAKNLSQPEIGNLAKFLAGLTPLKKGSALVGKHTNKVKRSETKQ